jgi:hypothetical protein
MSKAKTDVDPSWAGVRRNEGILVMPNQARSMVGSCNACTDMTHQVVTEVNLRGMCFRLCEHCRVELVGLLK